MNIKALDKKAKEAKEMPKGLNGYEQAYYIASRGLYQQYDRGELTLAQARIEKEQVVQMYKQAEEEWQYFVKLHQIEDQLKKLKEDGFNTVIEFEILEILEELLK